MYASVGVVRSVPTQQLSPFYLLSTRDVSRVISFTRPSSRLIFSGKRSTAREDGLGMRLLITNSHFSEIQEMVALIKLCEISYKEYPNLNSLHLAGSDDHLFIIRYKPPFYSALAKTKCTMSQAGSHRARRVHLQEFTEVYITAFACIVWNFCRAV